MFFGVRLPGPFRVGVSSKGKVYGGVTVGPFSASTPIGGGSAGAASGHHPISLDAAVAELLRDGWKVAGRGDGWTQMRYGWRVAVHIDAVPGGVQWRQVTNSRKVIAWLVVIAGVVLFCGPVIWR